jgi:peptide chain release factor subunit 1
MTAPRERFGFIVIGGRRCAFGLVCGDRQTVLEAFNVDLPRKHGMGGQSAPRFQRIAEEARHHLRHLVGECAQRRFVSSGIPNVTGLVLAGCAQLKNQLESSDLLGDRLRSLVIGVVDVAYDGEQGFVEAVKKSRHLLSDVASVREQQRLERLFEAAGRGENCAFGVSETMVAWEYRIIATLFLCREVKMDRVVKRNGEVVCCKQDESLPETAERQRLVDWIIENYKTIGCELVLVGSHTAEGAQFMKGLGGIGSILRIPLSSLRIDEDRPAEFDVDFDFDL